MRPISSLNRTYSIECPDGVIFEGHHRHDFPILGCVVPREGVMCIHEEQQSNRVADEVQALTAVYGQFWWECCML
jgi:hypothetical protein